MAGGYGYDRYSNHYNFCAGRAARRTHAITLSGREFCAGRNAGVSDVTVRGQTNVTTDAAGYAVVPYVRPYHRNSRRWMNRNTALKWITSPERWFRRAMRSSK
ncbi:fimbria/pilus outer membrane usher protein [Klebsiella pneumoniae]|uniref:fimbria/pilus outer membrane usher protein n=1 Tax=Klebsiella pneumoniae TaxID=573 RepID=UPI00396F351E